MEYKITTIPPKGRNKYGNYSSTSNITKRVTSYKNGGNGSTGEGGEIDDGQNTQKNNYTLLLSRNIGEFEWDNIVAQQGQTDTINVIGYSDMVNIPTLVGDINILPEAIESGDTIVYNIPSERNYDITGIPSGMTVQVNNNGTSSTTISFKIDQTIQQTRGILQIPCSIYTGDENKAPWLPSENESEDTGNTGEDTDIVDIVEEYANWYKSRENCKTQLLEYNYKVTLNAVNNYHLELTNEFAGINCDANGNILTNAVRPTCQAILYLGNQEVETAVYGLSYSQYQSVRGVSIDTATGIVTFGSNFYFTGTNLELSIYATDKEYSVTKIMNINKVFPGADGSPAVTRWIVTDADVIKFNPNTNTLTPSTITPKVMVQEGDGVPYEDTITTIYYGWNTQNPTQILYNSTIAIEAGKEYLSLALKKNGEIYELETIPIIKEGLNGTTGESTYTLVLTNSNATVVCDADGNILEGATLPECEAYLYYGTELINNMTYTITSSNATGVSFTGNKITYASNFGFSGDKTELKVYAKRGSVTYATAIMNITKAKPGPNGEPAVRYYLRFSASLFKVNAKGFASPNSIEVTAYKQIGISTPEVMGSEGKILYGVNTYAPTQPYVDGIEYISTADFYTVHLLVDNTVVDSQTLPVLADGKDGKDGKRGATLRGPIDYNKVNAPRRFCNGELTDINYPEDGEFIDIISVLLPGEEERTFWRCIKSHTWDDRDIEYFRGGFMDEYWEESDKFNFIATEVLLAEHANIANFIFSNQKLTSQATGDDGLPMLELDGVNGIVKANKGIWKGAYWQNFVVAKNGKTLNVDEPNVKFQCQTSESTTLNVYLPEITKEIEGAKFCLYWDGETTRSATLKQFLRTKGEDYIIHLECLSDSSGVPHRIKKIYPHSYYSGYIELTAIVVSNVYNTAGDIVGIKGAWLITSILGKNWKVDTNTQTNVTIDSLQQ